MKSKDILGLAILGIIAWFFLKPKIAKAEEIEEISEIPKPETYTVPPPGVYIAKISPLEIAPPIKPAIIPKPEVKPVVERTIADIMEAIVERAKVSL